jgi:hypothetical protein
MFGMLKATPSLTKPLNIGTLGGQDHSFHLNKKPSAPLHGPGPENDDVLLPQLFFGVDERVHTISGRKLEVCQTKFDFFVGLRL